MKKPFKNNYNTSSKPIPKKDNKRLAAIILCCLMAFWTIASVLGIIGFARSFAKEKTISASADILPDVERDSPPYYLTIPKNTVLDYEDIDIVVGGTLENVMSHDVPFNFYVRSSAGTYTSVVIITTSVTTYEEYTNAMLVTISSDNFGNPTFVVARDYSFLCYDSGYDFNALKCFLYLYSLDSNTIEISKRSIILPVSNTYGTVYNEGFNDGEIYGYNLGYNSGYAVGYTEGEQVGRNNGRQDGYDEGYAVGYTEGEQVGREDGIDDGYEIGYDEGFLEGVQTGTQQGYDDGFRAGELKGQNDAHEYTFERLIGAVVDVPIQAFLGLFSFDLLGIDLSAFFLSLLTVCAILAVVRFIL